MKNILHSLLVFLFFTACSTAPSPVNNIVPDGAYEVIRTGSATTNFGKLASGQLILNFDTLFNPDDVSRVLIDTNDYVPMELETAPNVALQPNGKKLLSVTLTPAAAAKMKTFTAKRVMKHVVIVLDGKAITMHLIREGITGNEMQITRCNDDACEYLLVKMKHHVKK